MTDLDGEAYYELLFMFQITYVALCSLSICKPAMTPQSKKLSGESLEGERNHRSEVKIRE
jgi:hypothetical protein